MSDIKYFSLPREMVEAVLNFPPTSQVYRKVNIYLKDGSVRSDVVVIGNEFYAMDERTHKYFEPRDIALIEAA